MISNIPFREEQMDTITKTMFLNTSSFRVVFVIFFVIFYVLLTWFVKQNRKEISLKHRVSIFLGSLILPFLLVYGGCVSSARPGAYLESLEYSRMVYVLYSTQDFFNEPNPVLTKAPAMVQVKCEKVEDADNTMYEHYYYISYLVLETGEKLYFNESKPMRLPRPGERHNPMPLVDMNGKYRYFVMTSQIVK